LSSFINFIANVPTSDTTFYTAKCFTPYTDQNFTAPITNAGVYYITLVNSSDCDSVICLTLNDFPDPQLCMISVDNNNHNEIVWKKQEEIVSYNIYREGMQIGNYDLAANVSYNSPNTWTDMESNAKIRSYTYKVAGIDSCGNESALSSPHKTMHLTINAGVNNSWNLIWTAYEGPNYSTYQIFRAVGDENGHGDFDLIGTMPINTTSNDFSAPNGYIYYMVEILLDEPCVQSRELASIKSNIATNAPDAINETALMSAISVYPNPTTGELRITGVNKWTSEQVNKIELYDVFGRNINLSTRPLVHSSTITLDISHLPVGIYFVRINTENGSVTKKVIKKN
jgi:hypothetical protein